MKLDFANERVLAIVAHPDDAELLCAGTLARARDDGAVIGICILCLGDKGQPAIPIENLAEVRAAEAQAAARLLSADLLLAGFPDGELQDDVASRRIVLQLVRRFQPSLILAHAPSDYHADHRAASAISEAVSWFAASAGHPTEHPALPQPPALWWMDTVTMAGFEPGFYIDVSRHMQLKRDMLASHCSQSARSDDENFSPLDTLLVEQARARGRQSEVEAAEAFRMHHGWKRSHAW